MASHARPGGPGHQHQARQAHGGLVHVKREAASDLGLNVAQIATPLRTLVAGTTVGNWRAPDDQTYDVNVRLAPEARTTRTTWSACRCVPASTPTAAAHRAAEPGGHVRESTGPNQINRRDLTARSRSTPTCWAAAPARCRPTSAPRWTIGLPAGLPLQLRRLHQEHAGVLRYASRRWPWPSSSST
jgi:hypothetical protein